MKNIILSSDFYQDIDVLNSIISNMEFEQSIYGTEILEFNFIPTELTDKFNTILNEEVEVQLGTFRKSNDMVHFENFYQHSLWKCIVAIEDTKLKIHEQDNIKTFFDVENINEFMLQNNEWKEKHAVSLNKNDFVFIRPWMWHSLEENKLVQVFLLNQQIKGEVI